MVTLEKARELLGEEYTQLSDQQVLDLMELIFGICEYVVSLDEVGELDD